MEQYKISLPTPNLPYEFISSWPLGIQNCCCHPEAMIHNLNEPKVWASPTEKGNNVGHVPGHKEHVEGVE